MAEALYDRIGPGYAQTRRTDPRIAAAIAAALGDAATVINVGAGAGGYEPADREVTAVEPSAEMIAQRAPDAAPVTQANAESLPFDDDSFDAAMAVHTVHHWPDLAAGLGEMRRVSRERIVVLTNAPGLADDLWISDYFTDAPRGNKADAVSEILGDTETIPVPIPRDCTDLFFWALWARPELFLDDEVVKSMWIWNIMDAERRDDGRRRLASDLADGTWEKRYGAAIRDAETIDCGMRIVVARL